MSNIIDTVASSSSMQMLVKSFSNGERFTLIGMLVVLWRCCCWYFLSYTTNVSQWKMISVFFSLSKILFCIFKLDLIVSHRIVRQVCTIVECIISEVIDWAEARWLVIDGWLSFKVKSIVHFISIFKVLSIWKVLSVCQREKFERTFHEINWRISFHC